MFLFLYCIIDIFNFQKDARTGRIDPATSEIIGKCLNKDQTQRMTAEDLVISLERKYHSDSGHVSMSSERTESRYLSFV